MGWLDRLGGGEAGVKAGERAPEFTLPDADGKPVRLADFRGRPLVLYFYPQDETPGCTKEACSFRDQFEDFRDAGAAVVGVSSDSSESHRKFAARHRLPFTLLADTDGRVREQYRIPKTLGLLPGRVTFVIDADGVVRHQFNSQLAATRHVAEALRVVREIASRG